MADEREPQDAMPISVTATEVARNFTGVMEKARAAGRRTGSRPGAGVVGSAGATGVVTGRTR